MLVDGFAFKGRDFWFATAREMVNILHAREDGRTEVPDLLRDYLYGPPPLLGGVADGRLS